MTTGLESVATWPGRHPAAGWRTGDGRTATAGDADQPLRLASVTKLFTATAVLVAVQEGVLDLDEPAGPPGATVRLLLAHASGLPFDGDVPIAPPATRRIYGNAAFERLGRLLQERTELPAADYVREAVFEPLGMTTALLGSSPAHGGHASVVDLLAFAAELLRPGRVLAPELLAEAITPQLPGLRGVLPGFGRQDPNPWGLGFEVHGTKAPHWMPAEASPRAFGHFGQSGSFLWVDPDADVACCGLSDRAFGDWARTGWPDLGRAVLAAIRA